LGEDLRMKIKKEKKDFLIEIKKKKKKKDIFEKMANEEIASNLIWSRLSEEERKNIVLPFRIKFTNKKRFNKVVKEIENYNLNQRRLARNISKKLK